MPVHYHAWHTIGERYGFSYSKETFYKYAGIPTYNTVAIVNKLFNLNLDPVKITNEKEEIFINNLHMVKPIEQVVRIVREYYHKLPLSIGTGSPKDIAIKTLEAANLKNYFEIIVTSQDVINHKPYPDTFLECAKRMNIDPKYCQVFEDGALGIQAAQKAGMMVTDVNKLV